MKPASITRILAGLSFLIFLCPFFQTCSFDAGVVSDAIIGRPHHEKTEQEKLAEEKQNTYSGYRLAGIYTTSATTSTTVFFFIIFLVSVAIFYFALQKNYDNVFWFSAINLVLLMLCIIILLPIYIAPIITVRYGFYLLFCNTIALIIFSRKAYKQSESYIFTKPTI